MADLPLLVFPKPATADRSLRDRSVSDVKFPSASTQAARIGPQLLRLQASLNQKAAILQDNTHGLKPEQVLVIETIGPVDNFVAAVDEIFGLKLLGESELEDVQPDFGFVSEKSPAKRLKGQLFLVMTDQRALGQMLGLFRSWQDNDQVRFPPRLAPLKNAFAHLYDIRPWSVEDRLRDTGLEENWLLRQAEGQETVPFEAELWFHKGAARRRNGEAFFREAVAELNGSIESQCVIEEIRYHGLLGRIPIQAAQEIVRRGSVKLLKCEDIMFLRPVGQCSFSLPADSDNDQENSSERELGSVPEGEPVVAMLDGLPLIGHQYLNGRIIVDDPDNFEEGYQAASRSHGTAMASLICHGDLNGPTSTATRPLYARPILRPVQDLQGNFREYIPDTILPVDLVHRAVHRMFEAEGAEPPAAPHVRVINLSVCDSERPYIRELSPWSRLLDWLSWKYNVLFIVSAGNHVQEIVLPVPRTDLGTLGPPDRQKAFVEYLANDTRNRRLLSPAETFNGITVGGVHDDFSADAYTPNQIDPYTRRDLPAVYSAHGHGYRRAIKPEVLFPGGRQLLRERAGNTHSWATLDLATFSSPPGQLVAMPGKGGILNQTCHSRGTSNATALASHAAGKIFDVLEALRSESPDGLPEEYDAVLIKALLAHGASHGPIAEYLKETLQNPGNNTTTREYLGRFLGYGRVDASRVLACTEQRVTMLGYGELEADQAHEFSLPVPPSLSATTTKRRLTITLAWFTDVSASRQNYRKAHLWFDPKNDLAPERQEANHRAVQRGTLQHEILNGDNAEVFQEGDRLAIKVNCRADAGDINEPVRYGLAVTLEVAEGINLPIYEEVQARLRVQVPARLGSSQSGGA